MQMTIQETTATSSWSAELESLFEQLQKETIWLTLPGLFVIGIISLTGKDQFRDSYWGGLLCVLIFALALIVVGIGRWNYTAAAYTLVIGCLMIDLVTVAESGLTPAVFLLVIPAGLATLTITRLAGVSVAAMCTLYLLAAPPALVPTPLVQRAVASLAVWCTVGMILLVLRPLLKATEMMWAGYERSLTLLEQSRDFQQRLAETLSDLTAANMQLTHLNQQAQLLRQAAEDERRAKEQFVANVSHELRTPLNMIVGFAEMMLRTPETYGDHIPPSLLADLAVVLRNSQHLSSLIDDVLDLSQIQAGQLALSKERVSLAEMIQAATIAVRPLFESKNLYLETEVAKDLPLVLCDLTRIREVVLNLMSNAGRFTEHGGVCVKAWQEGSDVVVSVADTGPGIAEEDKDKLFQPFQQLDGTLRRRHGGSGLGLSISKNFVDLHNGRIWFESKKGVGTTLFFRLPISPPEPVPTTFTRWFNPHQVYEGRNRPTRLKPVVVPPRVVVVERGESLQRLFRRYVEGLEIIPVKDLDEAFQELAQTPAQALLVNTEKPDEALKRLTASAALPSGIPALVCSLPSDADAITALGVANYLTKPITRDALLGALEHLGKKIERVLVVDDEPDALHLFRRMLSTASRHYRVFRATNGQQALELLRTQQPDVMLLDLVMPEMNGYQLLAIKNQSPDLRDIPVILISAKDLISQPLVSRTLSVTLRDGLPLPQLLASLKSLSAILVPPPSANGPRSLAASPD
jgi:signal transduction histidine kinase/DNA-binding response OmpR family regulator